MNLSSRPPSNPSERISVCHLDGSPEQLEIAKLVLEGHNLEVESFTSPNKMLRRIEGCGCACVISGYKLSDMTVLDLIGKIRERRDMKFFLYTSFDRSDIDEKVLDEINGFFKKDGGLKQYDDTANEIISSVKKKDGQALESRL